MLTVIGCGNLARCDDGVGVVVAQRLIRYLESAPHADVRVFDAGTGGMDVMFRARGADRLILVDACRTGAEAGAVFRVPGAELESRHEPSYSLHNFRWDHALHAGRRIFGDSFPKDVAVYLIEAQTLAYGLELSAPVRQAVERVTGEIQSIVDRYVEKEAGLADTR